ncbi:epoxide hydrolase family protein [Chitinophaga sp. Hz27]|uniref:epoxide hydrolase family protein n=1 Tax=Chitinophaga sp. Hz27 TaxID=3347169 RepID=UPI0035DA6752
MQKMKPFQINVAQDILDDLQVRLARTRWTDEPADAGWNYGMNPAYLRELVDYWQHSYDWRKQEEILNSFPQYKTEIDGVGIHFIWVKGKGNGARPLILTHEWPDSFQRFYKIIPMLTEDSTFDLIIPSMPGHGFSDPVSLPSAETARLWGKLMTEELGYTNFYAGGDYAVTTSLANQYPEQVKGIYLTDAGYPNGTEDWSQLTPAEQVFGQQIQRWFYAEGAFNMIQSTKPQTLGYALNDSPVGLASWILEKFYTWSDTKGNMDNSFSKDELLTNVMIYWITGTINTSIRRYAMDMRAMYAQGFPAPVQPVTVPSAVAIFPADSDTPKEWAERRVNLQYYDKLPKGGRFAALEVPELYTDYLRKAIKTLEEKAL